MEAHQREVFNALKRIQVFVSETPLPVPLRAAPSGFQVQVQALNTALAQMDTSAVRKGSGDVHRRTKYRHHLRNVLRYRHLQPIRKVARILERSTPGLPNIVNLPRLRGSERALITAAKATLEDVAPFRHLFIAKGLPDNFVSLLQEAIAAMEKAGDEYENVRMKKVDGRAGIVAAMREGMDARQCLTLIVERCCEIDPTHGSSTLEAWYSAARIHHLPVGREGAPGEVPGIPETSEEGVAVPGEV